MKQEKQILRIQRISATEWDEAIKKLGVYILRTIRGKTKYGAHSELVLGMSALDYYTGEAIEALLSGEWEWKEEMSLSDQLTRIAWSKISAQVEKYKRRMELHSTVGLNVAGNVLNSDDESEDYYLICQEAALGDEELELYVKAVHRCNTFDEVCSEMGGSDKKYIYNLQRKLKRRIISLSKK